jgi:exopolyphosphatase/guanosine-5'-triphosphate,3'-diphosphate pyrophosphatase
LIVPRWEWRTFGEEFGDAETRLAALTPERVAESDEVYLLSSRSDASVKVREGVMDVKVLEGIDDEGLEQWKPILKAGFPLSSADADAVLTALGAEDPELVRSAYSFEELLQDVVASNPWLTTVDVHKERRHYTFGGCMAELSELRTPRGATRTIAVESEDPARVTAGVRELGLQSRRNVNVARGLKTLLGIGARRFAVIDVGTNSVKFHVGERAADGGWRTIADRAELTRLGEGLDETGQLGDEAIERTGAAVTDMADEARGAGAEELAAVGTAGLRIASNSGAFLEAVRDRAGIEVEVISGEEEARLAYLAATSGLGLGLGHGSLVVFDTGGGSSQFTFGHGEHVDERFSVNVGAARFTERFGLDEAVDDGTLAFALDVIASDLARLDDRPTPESLVGMGGAITNMAAVKHELVDYDPNVVQGTVLESAEIDRQIELYRSHSADERRGIVGLQPKRAEVILAGACIVRTVLSKLASESLTVSDRGLRHGLLIERFGS